MHARSASALTRILVTALLLLAVSPVTAPFLTLDLKDLGGESTAPGVALVQPKTTHDESVATVGVTAAVQVSRTFTTSAAAPKVYRVSRSTAFRTPLRI
jgi:hypothetical protein